jgi:hypothetical protein
MSILTLDDLEMTIYVVETIFFSNKVEHCYVKATNVWRRSNADGVFIIGGKKQ